MMQPVPSSPELAPRRHFRGKRRYFRRVREAADAFGLDATETEGWSLWHYHADWPGWGNLSWRFRRQHLEANARVFLNLAHATAAWVVPFQLWLYLASDAGQDATYLHTETPKGAPFPMVPTDVQWGVPDPQGAFARLLPGRPLRIGLCSSEANGAGKEGYFVYSPGIGVALE